MTARPAGPASSMHYQGHVEEVVTVTFKGRATIARPAPGHPWAWTEEYATCAHKHPTREAADKCGRQLGERKAREANKTWRATVAVRPCVLATGTETDVFGGDPGYIRYCTVHDTSATKFHKTVTDAEMDAWICPWSDITTASILAGGEHAE